MEEHSPENEEWLGLVGDKVRDDDFELGTACGLTPEECESCQ